MVDDRTGFLNLPLPHVSNDLNYDVNRLRASFQALDAWLEAIQNELAAPGGIATLDAQGRVPTAQLPEVLFGSVSYQGGWDAATNAPAIPAAAEANKGHYYLVTTAGSTTIDGVDDWVRGDWIVSNGATWDRVANSEVFDASAIASGIFPLARIPDIPASKVTGLNDAIAGKFDVAGGAFTGKISSVAQNSAMAVSDASSVLEVRNASGSGDAGLAMMAFLAQGAYGIKMGVRADGYFGIGGWSRAPWSWYTDTSGNMIAAGNVGAYSDPRLKDNVSRIAGALGIIQRLDGVRFTWNGKTRLIGKPGQNDIGVLADQVEAVLPEAVSRSIPDADNDNEQWRVVAYDKLVPVLIEAVKELAAENDNLKARLAKAGL